jgi:hypothetical protein
MEGRDTDGMRFEFVQFSRRNQSQTGDAVRSAAA